MKVIVAGSRSKKDKKAGPLGLPKWNGKWPLGRVTVLPGCARSVTFDFHAAGKFSGTIDLPWEEAKQLAAMILDTGGEIDKYWTDVPNPFGDPRNVQELDRLVFHWISKGVREP